jgi:hypothetical protein
LQKRLAVVGCEAWRPRKVSGMHSICAPPCPSLSIPLPLSFPSSEGHTHEEEWIMKGTTTAENRKEGYGTRIGKNKREEKREEDRNKMGRNTKGNEKGGQRKTSQERNGRNGRMKYQCALALRCVAIMRNVLAHLKQVIMSLEPRYEVLRNEIQKITFWPIASW